MSVLFEHFRKFTGAYVLMFTLENLVYSDLIFLRGEIVMSTK